MDNQENDQLLSDENEYFITLHRIFKDIQAEKLINQNFLNPQLEIQNQGEKKSDIPDVL